MAKKPTSYRESPGDNLNPSFQTPKIGDFSSFPATDSEASQNDQFIDSFIDLVIDSFVADYQAGKVNVENLKAQNESSKKKD